MCVCYFVLALRHTPKPFRTALWRKRKDGSVGVAVGAVWAQSRATRSPLAIGCYFGRRLFGPLRWRAHSQWQTAKIETPSHFPISLFLSWVGPLWRRRGRKEGRRNKGAISLTTLTNTHTHTDTHQPPNLPSNCALQTVGGRNSVYWNASRHLTIFQISLF